MRRLDDLPFGAAMTPTDRLAEAGRLLHGPSWQTPLAEDLGVALRSVQYWARKGVPPKYWPQIRALLLQRARDAKDFARALPR